jgi:hypothetical protein
MGKTIFKVTEDMKQQIVALYNQGLMDSEIAKQIGGITDGTVFYWRKKLGLKTKFDYSQVAKIDNKKFEKLFKQGLSDYAIAKELGMSPDGVFSHRQRHGYTRDSLMFAKPIPLTDFQKEVLIGTLLGDSSLRRHKKSWNTEISCAHGIKQKEYCEYKTEIFKSLGAHCEHHIRKTPDKRNGICYEDYTMRVPSNPELNSWYEAFYPNGKKVIPSNLFNYFTAASLAFMFMDDGCKTSNSYSISTNCFQIEELIKFCQMLKDKFNIDTTIWKSHVVYIKANSRNLFEHLIKPYMCNCMLYKLQVSLNSVNLGKSLRG